ncbi:KV08 protein, partial [Atractosteus spatula]|nr:KV08 protein [Atractosteus spatula]
MKNVSLSMTIFALCVPGVLTDVISQPHLSVTAQLGKSVILPCFVVQTRPMTLAWLKQDFGQTPKYIVTLPKFSEKPEFHRELNQSFSDRFKVRKTARSFTLTIFNIQSADTALYYCGAFMYKQVAIGNGTLLLLKGSELISRSVLQPLSLSVQPGDNVTLQCTIHTETCAGLHSVYWFRHGSGESLPGIIYTHGNRSDQCNRSFEAGFPTQSCAYNLPKRNLSLSDAGTYYCAVATCGEILFGNGTPLEITGTLSY